MELSRSTARAKRACCDKGYVTDAFSAMLAPDVGSRSSDPLMHRGYYARFRAVDLAVRAFLAHFGAGNAQVVVLGAGLDSMFWRLRANGLAPAKYFEIDSEVVVVEKRRLIRFNPALLAGADDDACPYRLVAADLRDVDGVDAALAAAGVDARRPTLVLAECVLAYLAPENGDALVAWAKRTFSAGGALFAAYDVIAPPTGDRFGARMLANFRDRGAPLLGAASSLAAVRARFAAYGAVDARDMRAVFRSLVLGNAVEFRRVAALEIFDDPDQFDLIMAHYVFALAGTGPAEAVVAALVGPEHLGAPAAAL